MLLFDTVFITLCREDSDNEVSVEVTPLVADLNRNLNSECVDILAVVLVEDVTEVSLPACESFSCLNLSSCQTAEVKVAGELIEVVVRSKLVLVSPEVNVIRDVCERLEFTCVVHIGENLLRIEAELDLVDVVVTPEPLVSTFHVTVNRTAPVEECEVVIYADELTVVLSILNRSRVSSNEVDRTLP